MGESLIIILSYFVAKRFILFCNFIFRDLLYSTDIEVSYFAAGIAAHLSSYSLESWTVKTITKEQLIQDLVTFVFCINCFSCILNISFA